MVFTEYVADTFDFRSIDIGSVMQDCPFVRQSSVDDLTNDGERFVL